MKHLNHKATEVFLKLAKAVDGYDLIRIENDPLLKLSVERLENETLFLDKQGQISVPVYRIMQTYDELDGTRIYEPEMQFLLIDNPYQNENEKMPKLVIPYLYYVTQSGLVEISIIFHEKRLPNYNLAKQEEHTEIANSWMLQLKQDGFLIGLL